MRNMILAAFAAVLLLSSAARADSITATAACGAAGSVVVGTAGSGAVGVNLAGTWVGTIAYSLTIDGTNWTSVSGVASQTANGQTVINTAGFYQLCAAATAWTSGTATVIVSRTATHTDSASAFVPFFNDAVAGTVVQIKATTGVLSALSLVNTTAAAAYVQIFFLPSASVTVGTTPANMTIRLLASAAMTLALPAPVGWSGTGLSMAGTTTATGAVGAAVSVSAVYK